jgi:hypothetical protein
MTAGFISQHMKDHCMIVSWRNTVVMALLYSVALGNNCSGQPRYRVRVHDDALGVTFTAVGATEKSDSSTYSMILQSSDPSRLEKAIAEVSLSDRLFVDLPSSYGGRVYFDTPAASPILQSRLLVDSVSTGLHKFRREYWAVYAGMGMWEGLINCYAQSAGRYCLVSLVWDMPIGKPGAESDDGHRTSEWLQQKCLSSLQDTTNALVRDFNVLLSSVEVHNP